MTQLAPRVGESSRASTLPIELPSPLVAVGPIAGPSTPNKHATADWSRVLVRRLVVADLVCALLAAGVGLVARLGLGDLRLYIACSIIVAVAWLVGLATNGSYEVRRIATGTHEYHGVVRAGAVLAGSVAIICYLFNSLVGRTFVAIVIPTGIVLMVLARFLLRKAVYRHRRRGLWSSAILAVGTSESVQHLADIARRAPEAGLLVVGACVEDGEIGAEIAPGVPVVGGVSSAARMAEELDVDVVAVAGSGLGPRGIRELGWALEGTRRRMVMAPGLTEVAGPRVHVSPVDGLPLMWVDQPEFTGTRRVVKRVVDVLVAGGALLVASPLLLVIALRCG